MGAAARGRTPRRPVRHRADATARREIRLGRALRVGDRAAGGVCVLALILMAALLVGIVSGYRPLVDHSDSMRPAIRAGDLLITHAEPAGSIASRRDRLLQGPGAGRESSSPTESSPSIRRGRGCDFITKGDANAAPESWSAARGSLDRGPVVSGPGDRQDDRVDGRPAGPYHRFWRSPPCC